MQCQYKRLKVIPGIHLLFLVAKIYYHVINNYCHHHLIDNCILITT